MVTAVLAMTSEPVDLVFAAVVLTLCAVAVWRGARRG